MLAFNIKQLLGNNHLDYNMLMQIMLALYDFIELASMMD